VRAAIYARISDDRAGTGLGVARQLKDCRDLAHHEGWTIVAEHTDNDLSAYTGKPRPGYTALCDQLTDGAVEVVVVWAVDRLYRRPVELEALVDLVETSGATVATVTSGRFDLATPEGRAMARVGAAIAASESERKSIRNRRKALELAEAGKLSGGGTRPFGYEDDRVTVRLSEADAIRDAVRRVLAGESLWSITRDWQARGIVTPSGGPWRIGTLRRMLTSWRIAGVRSLKDEPVAVAVWPPIVDRADLERVRAVLLDPSRRTTNRQPRAYPLRGLAVCGRCGTPLVAAPKVNRHGERVRNYRCQSPPQGKGCGRLSILADTFEREVFERVAARIAGDGLSEVLATLTADNADADSAAGELVAVRDRLEVLSTDYYERGTVSRSEYERRRAALERQVSDLEGRLAQVSGSAQVAALPTSPAAIVATLTERDAAWSRTLVGVFVAEVVVATGVRGLNRFDPDRVKVRWIA